MPFVSADSMQNKKITPADYFKKLKSINFLLNNAMYNKYINVILCRIGAL